MANHRDDVSNERDPGLECHRLSRVNGWRDEGLEREHNRGQRDHEAGRRHGKAVRKDGHDWGTVKATAMVAGRIIGSRSREYDVEAPS